MKERITKRGCIAGIVQLGGMGGVAAELATHQDIKVILPTALVAAAGLIAGIRVSRTEVIVSQASKKETAPLARPIRETRPSATTLFDSSTEPIDVEFRVKPPTQN